MYKLLIFYEWFEIFDYFYQKEVDIQSSDAAILIKYSIQSSSLRFTVYFTQKYFTNFDFIRIELIEELLLNIELNSKMDILDKHQQKWTQIEQKIFCFESLLSKIPQKQARLASQIIGSMLQKEAAECVYPGKGSKIVLDILNLTPNMLYLNSFVMLAPNPLKLWVQIITSLMMINSILHNSDAEKSIKDATKLALSIIDNTDNLNEVKMMLYDKWVNGDWVIDLITYYKIWDIMENSKVSAIIGYIWTSPFKTSLIVQESNLALPVREALGMSFEFIILIYFFQILT